MNIKLIKIEDKKYPNALKLIKDAPKSLYVMGNENLLNEKCFAIIGSRVCSNFGSNVANEYAQELAKRKICIISGMAKGIDTEAHKGALKENGKTIAVLGSGFNYIFPKENIDLAKKIIDSGGAIISEYEPNTKVFSEGFRQRNRIISGLSMGVLIVEAKSRSGTSITAKYAKQQNKKIFCIAHGVNEKEGEGTNRLIKNGAFLVTEPEDIINQFQELKSEIFIEKQKISVPDEYMEIYKLIGKRKINIDEIYRKAKCDFSKINYCLTMLEMEGYIKSYPGKFYEII